MMPELKGFEVVEKFLELSDRKDFITYLNNLYKTSKQQELEEMVHQNGSANINLNADLITFSKNATSFAKHDREGLDR